MKIRNFANQWVFGRGHTRNEIGLPEFGPQSVNSNWNTDAPTIVSSTRWRLIVFFFFLLLFRFFFISYTYGKLDSVASVLCVSSVFGFYAVRHPCRGYCRDEGARRFRARRVRFFFLFIITFCRPGFRPYSIYASLVRGFFFFFPGARTSSKFSYETTLCYIRP